MSQPERLLLDACQCINLAAAGLLGQVSSALGMSVRLVPQVAQEALYLHSPEGGTERVELRALELVELTEEELESYILLASKLDDGEAATVAVAAHRGWIVGTDDRAAIRTAHRLGVPFTSIGTTEVVRRCTTGLSLPRADISRLISAIESRARYIPRRDDPHSVWWSTHR